MTDLSPTVDQIMDALTDAAREASRAIGEILTQWSKGMQPPTEPEEAPPAPWTYAGPAENAQPPTAEEVKQAVDLSDIVSTGYAKPSSAFMDYADIPSAPYAAAERSGTYAGPSPRTGENLTVYLTRHWRDLEPLVKHYRMSTGREPQAIAIPVYWGDTIQRLDVRSFQGIPVVAVLGIERAQILVEYRP